MALLPPNALNAVVSIGVDTKDEAGNVAQKPIATGFLFGKLAEVAPDASNNKYNLYLVTNRHVFEDPFDGSLLEKISLKFNVDDKKNSKIYVLNLVDSDKKPLWLGHSNKSIDLAVILLDINRLVADKIEFNGFKEDQDVFLAKDFEKEGVSMGDSVFVLGYPLGITAKVRNLALVKEGIISRYDDETIKEGYFFIDANVYPGNSGGPVLIKPELSSVGNTRIINKSALVGVISEGVTYTDVAFSKQTRRPRIAFEEQTGITKVVPVEYILEVIEDHNKKIGETKKSGVTKIE